MGLLLRRYRRINDALKFALWRQQDAERGDEARREAGRRDNVAILCPRNDAALCPLLLCHGALRLDRERHRPRVPCFRQVELLERSPSHCPPGVRAAAAHAQHKAVALRVWEGDPVARQQHEIALSRKKEKRTALEHTVGGNQHHIQQCTVYSVQCTIYGV